MFKVNNKDTYVNSEHISHLVLVFLLLTLNINCRLGFFTSTVQTVWIGYIIIGIKNYFVHKTQEL